MIPIRELEDYDRELIEKIDDLTRRFYGINDGEIRVGFVGGMFHGDRPLKDKDIIVCVPDPADVCAFAKELYCLGFDKVEISENPYEAAWALIRLWFKGTEYQVQVYRLDNIFQRINKFPLGIQKKAMVVDAGICVFYQDKDALALEGLHICYVDSTGDENWKYALDKYRVYYPNMSFLVDAQIQINKHRRNKLWLFL